MKKLLILFLMLFSSSAFSETYFCSHELNTNIFKRQGMEFSYKTPSRTSTMKIVEEDYQNLFLMGNFQSDGSTVVAINKITGRFSTLYLSPNLGRGSDVFRGRCMVE